MPSIEPVAKRHREYRWGERYQFVGYLSLSLLIVGMLFIVLGLAIPVVLLSGSISLPYALSTRLAIGILSLVFGLFFGLICMSASRILLLLKELEHHTRYAMNIWLILEERDFGGEEDIQYMESAMATEDKPIGEEEG